MATCEYEDPETGNVCGEDNSQPFAVGMVMDPERLHERSCAGTFEYMDLCAKHLEIVQRRMGQK